MQNSTTKEPVTDDTQTVIVSSHVLVRDKQTQQILVNQRDS